MNTVHTGSEKSIMPEAVVNACDVTLPVLINTEDVRKGDELVCHWPVVDTAPKRQPPITKSPLGRARRSGGNLGPEHANNGNAQ